MFRSLGFAALVLLVLMIHGALAATCKPHAAEHREVSLDGYQREYWLYIPCSVHQAADLVTVLHGFGGDAEPILANAGWIDQAERHGFVVAVPQALPIRTDFPKDAPLPPIGTWRAHNNASWWTSQQLAATANTHHPDDVAFLSGLHRELEVRGIATGRFFVAGFSNGAFLAKQFALERGKEVDAVVANGYMGQVPPGKPLAPVSILETLGTIDETGGVTEQQWKSMTRQERLYWRGATRPTLDTDATLWAKIDGCKGSPVIEKQLWGETRTWQKCEKKTEVKSVSVNGLGHEWVGSKLSNWTKTHPEGARLSETEMAVDFFLRRR